MAGATSPSDDTSGSTGSTSLPGTTPSFARGARVTAAVLVLSAGLDVVVGLSVIGTAPFFGGLLLGTGVAEVYLAYGIWHRQRWAFNGTLVGQGVAAVPLALLTDPFLLAPKLAIAGYLLLTRNGDWR